MQVLFPSPSCSIISFSCDCLNSSCSLFHPRKSLSRSKLTLLARLQREPVSAAYSLRNTFQTLHVVTEDGFSLPSPTSTLSTCAQVTTHNLRSFSSRSTSSVTDSGLPHPLPFVPLTDCTSPSTTSVPPVDPRLHPVLFLHRHTTSSIYITVRNFLSTTPKVTLRLSFQPRPRLLSSPGNPSTPTSNFALPRHPHPTSWHQLNLVAPLGVNT